VKKKKKKKKKGSTRPDVARGKRASAGGEGSVKKAGGEFNSAEVVNQNT